MSEQGREAQIARELEQARLLGALGAKTENLEKTLDDRTRRIEEKIHEGTVEIGRRLDEMAGSMVTKSAFQPVRMITFGLMSIVGSAVVLAILARVLGIGANGG